MRSRSDAYVTYGSVRSAAERRSPTPNGALKEAVERDDVGVLVDHRLGDDLSLLLECIVYMGPRTYGVSDPTSSAWG